MPTVPLQRLEQWSPFTHAVWSENPGPLTVEEVTLAIAEGRLGDRPHGDDWSKWSRQQHVERVAYLVVYPDPTPIELDVGVPELGCHVAWPLQDGHHRLAAAFYRGDKTIEVDVSGSLDYAEHVLGVPVPSSNRQRIMEAVKRWPGKTSVELVPKLDGLGRKVVAARLSELRQAGLIRGEGRPQRYVTS